MTKYKVGDLIKWYTVYDDNLVKDSGLGMVINESNIEQI